MLAQDFVTSAKRLADPHLASGAYGYWVKYIKGMKEWHEDERHRIKTQFDLPMDGIRALDDFTLEITIVTPDPYFVHRL